MAEFPHYYSDYGPPKNVEANLEYRKFILTEAAKDPEFAATIWKLCKEDCLYYINTMCWTYNPRDAFGFKTRVSNLPFITYEFQDEAIAEGIDAITGGYDIAWPKSRAMGASWMGLSIFEWFWHFYEDFSFLLISRSREYVDDTGNPKTLFWKIDYLHKFQPAWLKPKMARRLKHLGNLDLDSVIDGEATTGNLARGDRRAAVFIDEFAAFDDKEGFQALHASRDVTNARFFNSTPQGSANAFYEVVHHTAARIVKMHWTKNPVYNQGMYTSEEYSKGHYKLIMIDKDYRGRIQVLRKGWDKPKFLNFPEEYPFILDGKPRSPWYDNQYARCVNKREVAQELDIDFAGSSYQSFDQELIRTLIKEYCSP